ncbi:MAG: hypothetical protein IPO45_10060 [Saprospiraceae bacterium]|uniref:hypothetical protein n=1 Tax=Candidatus Brachybacter algidus TaxID=2982024 RepID=UPI001D2ADE30|nr:hypothetical protein [Candidatus Brachybacter algidus]MBK6449309.1 hypothetical protein [Candidatus Brachybacter algidus]MBK8356030.1 hypothetical protein [Candidatus Brachybacter algidus]MBK9552512.1 hypothetical protein [Candidatus Brachybacter algidus]
MLSIEMAFQLGLPLNETVYYIGLFLAPVIYYTYAYKSINDSTPIANQRTRWFRENKKLVHWSQVGMILLCIGIFSFLIFKHFNEIIRLPLIYYSIGFGVLFVGIFYYGLISKKLFGFNLRNSGWTKAFIIGFVWACCANIFPLIMLRIETGQDFFQTDLWVWLFIKNWLFCTVNAIMFDIKDYPSDSNLYLRTFVVSFGLRRTIYFIIVPLLLAGLISFCIFALIKEFSIIQFSFNLIPFLLTLAIAFSMLRRHSIFYYLIVIDGVILVKALCGILGVLLTR